jgi:hypothetical protein
MWSFGSLLLEQEKAEKPLPVISLNGDLLQICIWELSDLHAGP